MLVYRLAQHDDHRVRDQLEGVPKHEHQHNVDIRYVLSCCLIRLKTRMKNQEGLYEGIPISSLKKSLLRVPSLQNPTLPRRTAHLVVSHCTPFRNENSIVQ